MYQCFYSHPQNRHYGFRSYGKADVGFCVSAQSRLYGSPVFCACVHAHPLFVGFTEVRCATRIGYTAACPPLNDSTKKLITDAERAQLLANGAMRAQGQAIDPVPVVKLFTPDACDLAPG